MQHKRIRRPVSGVLLLDKAPGLSSNQALQQAKRLYLAAKAGHTGSLDPFATGLLPVCFGEATKFSHFLLDADKIYRATLQLGVTTTTGDTEGDVLARAAVHVTPDRMERALRGFCGVIFQVPPMHSALKHQGRALYEYARAGVEIERPARQVTIHQLELVSLQGSCAEIIVSCSKGTYIRTLAEDLGAALGCGAHLTQLQRLGSGAFDLTQAVTQEQLEALSLAGRDSVLLPPDSLVQQLPEVLLGVESAHYLRRGQTVWQSGLPAQGLLRLYDSTRHFLGVGAMDEEGRLAPKRLVNDVAEDGKK